MFWPIDINSSYSSEAGYDLECYMLGSSEKKCNMFDMRLNRQDMTIFLKNYELKEDDHKTCIGSSSFQLAF